MSQLDEHDISNEDALSRGLRPEEDPWSSLAVADDDDTLNDNGIPSPAIGSADADADALDDPDPDIAIPSSAIAPRPSAAAAAAAAAHSSAGRRFVPDEDDDRDAAPALAPTVVRPQPDPESVTSSVPAPARAAEPDADAATDDDDHTVMTMLDPAIEPTRGGAFTIPLLCAGIAIIACCLLIPQADANRRLAYERIKLQADLAAVERQVAVNDEFLKKVSDDPNLAERLAQRQMKIIRAGTKVLALEGEGEHEMSPFQITAVAPPPELPPYQPHGGKLAALCYNPRSRLYLMGIGLLMTAVGLVLGFGPRSPD
jgi:hypothetical protein